MDRSLAAVGPPAEGEELGTDQPHSALCCGQLGKRASPAQGYCATLRPVSDSGSEMGAGRLPRLRSDALNGPQPRMVTCRIVGYQAACAPACPVHTEEVTGSIPVSPTVPG